MIADDALYALIDSFSMRLRRGQIKGSYIKARYTAELMREIVASARKGDTAQHIMDAVRKAGRHLVQAHPLAFVIGNIVRRVLYFIREEYVSAVQARSNRASAGKTRAAKKEMGDEQDAGGDDDGRDNDDFNDQIGDGTTAPSSGLLQDIWSGSVSHSIASMDDSLSITSSATELDITQQPSILTSVFRHTHLDYSKPVDIKAHVIDSITELIDDISQIYKTISDQATDHVHANEVILTCGYSKTVEHFLMALESKKRKFEVVIAEHSPDFNGQQLAVQLSKKNIQTTLVPDSAIFAMMARVNKVLIGTHAVMANGGLIAPSGTHMVALAANQHSVPVVVCTGLYKLTPLYPVDQYSFNEHSEPSEVISLQDGAYVSNAHIYNPAFDYIPPELVSLFITNQAGHNPSYIYRLLSEYYNAEDHVL